MVSAIYFILALDQHIERLPRFGVEFLLDAEGIAQHRVIGTEVVNPPVKHIAVFEGDSLIRCCEQRLVEAAIILVSTGR